MEAILFLRRDLLLLNHPFYQAWMEGRLSKESLQDYVCQYYYHVESFPGYLRQAMNHSANSEVHKALAENLAEEDGTVYGVSHPQLWLNFAKGLDVTSEEVRTAKPRGGIQNVVNTFNALATQSLATALGSLFAYEAQVPEIAVSKMEGLKRHFDITEKESLEFFEVHKTADIEHREVIFRLIQNLSAVEKVEAKKAADLACQALWDFLSDVYQVNGYVCAAE